MNGVRRAWQRLGHAREVLAVTLGMFASAIACGTAFHAGYELHLTHAHEVVTSCEPLAQNYAFPEPQGYASSQHCRAHDEAGRPLLFRFVLIDGMIFLICGIAAIEGLRPIFAPHPDLEEAET